MSKRKIINAFFKKKYVSNSKIRTPVAIETNVDISMHDEHPSKCSRIQSEEIDHDSGSLKQIFGFPINKQDEIRRAYLKEGPYQPKNIDYPYNDDTHHHRFQPSNQPLMYKFLATPLPGRFAISFLPLIHLYS